MVESRNDRNIHEAAEQLFEDVSHCVVSIGIVESNDEGTGILFVYVKENLSHELKSLIPNDVYAGFPVVIEKTGDIRPACFGPMA